MTSFSFVVCAAGRSERFRRALGETTKGSFFSKQFLRWANQPLFVHTLRALIDNTANLQEVVLAVTPGLEEDFSACLKEAALESVQVIAGGKRRQDSVRLGLEALRPCDFVGIHDGARPFVSKDLLLHLQKNLETNDAVIPGISLIETIKEVDADACVIRTHERSKLFRVQTPQCFRYEQILQVHQSLATTDREFTDDSAMAEDRGLSVKVIEGDRQNIKVTVPLDLEQKGIKIDPT